MIPRVTGKCFLTSSTTRRSSAMGALDCLSHRGFEQLGRLAVLRRLVQMAGLQVGGIVRDRHERRVDLLALVHNVWAARMEAAPVRRTEQRRRLSGDLDEALEVGVQSRQRTEQAPRVRVERTPEELLDGRLL